MAYKEMDSDNLIEIDSVSSFIEQVKKLRNEEIENGSSKELYFRGQETEFWDIEPSIFRNNMLSIEHKLMQVPLQKVPAEFKDFSTAFDIMTKYQHYGMCTRLLDLTTNPLVALYFACKMHGEEEYEMEEGIVEKEPYGVICFTNKYYSSLPSEQAVQIVSALSTYNLSSENTISEILEKLKQNKIIDNDTKERWLQTKHRQEFIDIIQNNYMVVPTYTNERLKKQSGVFLLASLFLFKLGTDINDSIISKTKGTLRTEFDDKYFYVSGDNKEEILKELDIYNINEATLFPELEHQLNHIRNTYETSARPVEEFVKYKEVYEPSKKSVYLYGEDLNDYIVNDFERIVKGVVTHDDMESIKNIIQKNFGVDWYKRESVLSGMRMDILGYYLLKKKIDKNIALKQTKQIMSSLLNVVDEFTYSKAEDGE